MLKRRKDFSDTSPNDEVLSNEREGATAASMLQCHFLKLQTLIKQKRKWQTNFFLHIKAATVFIYLVRIRLMGLVQIFEVVPSFIETSGIEITTTKRPKNSQCCYNKHLISKRRKTSKGYSSM